MRNILWLCLWLLVESTAVKMPEVRMYFENERWISTEASVLSIRTDEPVSGSLYLDDQCIEKISVDDFDAVENAFLWQSDVKQQGWYRFYDENDQLLAKAVLMENDGVTLGIDQFFSIVQDQCFFNRPATVYGIADASLQAFEEKPVAREDNWEIYTVTVDQEGVQTMCFKEKTWTFVLDLTAPQIDIPNHYISQPQEIVISDSFLDWTRSSLTVNGQDVKESCQKQENGYSFLLTETAVIEAEVWDFAGNQTTIHQKIVYDDQPPVCQVSFSDGKFYLEASDLALAPFEEISLYLNGVPVSFSQEENDCFSSINQDGVYRWQGRVYDLAGNVTEVDESMYLDVNAPEISCHYEVKDYYEKPLSVHLAWYDAGTKWWQLLLYRNGVLLHNEEGHDNGSTDLYLDDSDYSDGLGVYHASLTVSDGIHETKLERTWQLDVRCAPIEMSIQGADADLVEEITVLQPLEVTLLCSEADVHWQLYHEEDLLLSGVGNLWLLPESDATRLEMIAVDALGHESHKILQINCPQKENNNSLSLWENGQKLNENEWQMSGSVLQGVSDCMGNFEVYVDGKKTQSFSNVKDFEIEVEKAGNHEVAVVFKDENGRMSVFNWKVKGKKKMAVWMYAAMIGGFIGALDFMRRIFIGRLRNQQLNADFLDTATLEIDHCSNRSGDPY